MKQPWFCDTCLVGGTVTVPLHANVYKGAAVVLAHHARKSPDCSERYKIRVKACSNKEWRETLHNLRVERTSLAPSREAEGNKGKGG